MFIQTEETPNPATLKFLPGRAVVESGNVDFASSEGAARSPLADRLFKVEGVERVFLGQDFVTITKSDQKDWAVLKPALLGVIMEHFVSGGKMETKGAEAASYEGDDEIVKQIRELIDTRVRPAVAQDGGDIIYKGFEEGIVKLELHGSCSGCPSSTATLKQGIENMLKHYVPEVLAVEAVA